ncbi:MAG: hypothetical protein JNJ49_17450 [Bdellovibrionaceae bacterium]|nr:hypothetical protein [Pseudobdellovibrionaceae bacterium]
MQTIRGLLLILIAGLVGMASPTVAHAATIRGFLIVQPDSVRIRPLSNSSIRPPALPVEADLNTLGSLLSLRSGDFVVATGEMIDRDSRPGAEAVLIQGIESVGLQNLIGSWRTARWDVIRFEDFSRASLYSQTQHRDTSASSARPTGLAKLKELRYTLAPERANGYSIFLVESSSRKPGPVYVGRLELSAPGHAAKQEIKLDILDPSSGQVSESFHFTRLPGPK